jgi:hypothetical protein
VGTKTHQPRLTKPAFHRKAQQHTRFGVFNIDVDRFQARLVFQQRRLDRPLELVRGRRQMAIDFRQVVKSVIGKVDEPVTTAVQKKVCVAGSKSSTAKPFAK